MNYKIHKNVKECHDLRDGFQNLCQVVYGFDFRLWYEQGYWTDSYQPYVIVLDGMVVASASVNHMYIQLNESIYRLIQIGTVMTHPDFRERGLSKAIINEIIKDYEGNVDGIYLFANEEVLSFYPKFGFEAKHEVSYSIPQDQTLDEKWTKVSDISSQKLEEMYVLGNPYAYVQSIRNFPLLMFYYNMGYDACLYYHKQWNLYMFYDSEQSCIVEIFGEASVEWEELCQSLPTARLGFLPKKHEHLKRELFCFDDTLCFVSTKHAEVFENIPMFPLLSHA